MRTLGVDAGRDTRRALLATRRASAGSDHVHAGSEVAFDPAGLGVYPQDVQSASGDALSWRVDFGLATRLRLRLFSDLLHQAGAGQDQFPFASSSSGTMSVGPSSYDVEYKDHPGVLRIAAAATTNNSGGSLLTASTQAHVVKEGTCFEAVFRPLTGVAWAGFLGATDAQQAPGHGAWLEVSGAGGAVTCRAAARSSGDAAEYGSSTPSLVVGRWYRSRVELDQSDESVVRVTVVECADGTVVLDETVLLGGAIGATVRFGARVWATDAVSHGSSTALIELDSLCVWSGVDLAR